MVALDGAGLSLEHDLVASCGTPGPATPPLGWKRGGTATAHAPTNEDLEIGECHATALLRPDRAKREDRVERIVAVHG